MRPLSISRRPGFRTLATLLALLIALCIAIAGVCALVVRIPAGGARSAVVYYAAPTNLSIGAHLDPDDLRDALRRLDYRTVSTPPAPGEAREEARGTLVIHLRPFQYPDRRFPGGRLRVRLSGGWVVLVEPLDPMEPGDFHLEPEPLAGFEGASGRVADYLRLDDAPPLLVEAILAVEDGRFWKHPGVDPIGIARALLADLREGGLSQGASTLTQQLARSLYLHNRKTFLRKVQEVFLAFGLELRYSKREILEGYLNAVYWGQWGSLEIRGAREASRYYLGRELESADAAGLALVAGLIRAPNLYSPYSDPDRARRRRDTVLGLLRDRGVLNESEYRAALQKKIPRTEPPLRSAEASYFLDAARREMELRAPRGTLGRAGVSIFTTLDLNEQEIAVSGLREGLEALERSHRGLRNAKDPLEGSVVVIDPATGEIRALVGGRSFLRSPFNRATEAHRQPGSLFKPFVYLTAFRRPDRGDGTFWTPATLLLDEPLELTAGGKLWQPLNYDREFRGLVTVRQALEQSLNVPTARLGHELGAERVAETARDLGIESPLAEVPSLALGTSEVTLLEITGAYAALAAEGRAHRPTCLRGCMGPEEERIPLEPLPAPAGVRPPEAYLVTRLLEGVLDHGTGRLARALGVHGRAAGKTGTTDDYRDAWFVGYDPRRAVGVWVGFDQGRQVGLAGATAALPIWASIWSGIRGRGPEEYFEPPSGIVSAEICPVTGLRANARCPDSFEEVFLSGTEPTELCAEHGGFLRRFFRFFDQ